MKIFLEVLISLLIAIPLAVLLIFDLPGLGILFAIGLVGLIFVMKEKQAAELAGTHTPLIVGRTDHYKKAA